MTTDIYPPLSVPRSTSSWLLAVGVGAVATLVAIAMLQVSYVWTVLGLVGLMLFAGSLVVQDRKLYWFAVFLATIPLNISKMFFMSPGDVDRLMRSYGLLVNEIVVPLLHLSDLPLLMLLGIWMGEILAERRRIRVPSGLLFAVAFVLWCLLTSFTAESPRLALTWVFYQVKFVVLVLWLVNNPLSRKALGLVFALLVLNLVLQAGLVTISYKLQLGANFYGDLFGARATRQSQKLTRHAGEGYVYERGDQLRGSGTVGVGNETAKYLVPLLPLPLAGAIVARQVIYRVLCLLAFGVGMSGLYFTYSRGGLLSAMVALGILALLMAKRGFIGRKAFVTLVAAGLVVLVVSVPIFYRHLTARPGFFDLRLKHMRYGAEILASHPVLGVGANNFNVSLSKYDYGGIFASMPIHNHYLRLGIESGIVGLFLYLSFLAWIARLAYRSAWSEDILLASMAMGLVSGLIGYAIHWMDDLFYGVTVSTQWWALCGLIIAIYEAQRGVSLAKVVSYTKSRLSGANSEPSGAR